MKMKVKKLTFFDTLWYRRKRYSKPQKPSTWWSMLDLCWVPEGWMPCVAYYWILPFLGNAREYNVTEQCYYHTAPRTIFHPITILAKDIVLPVEIFGTAGIPRLTAVHGDPLFATCYWWHMVMSCSHERVNGMRQQSYRPILSIIIQTTLLSLVFESIRLPLGGVQWLVEQKSRLVFPNHSIFCYRYFTLALVLLPTSCWTGTFLHFATAIICIMLERFTVSLFSLLIQLAREYSYTATCSNSSNNKVVLASMILHFLQWRKEYRFNTVHKMSKCRGIVHGFAFTD